MKSIWKITSPKKTPIKLNITVDKDNQGPPVASPINIEIGGDMDYDQLIEEAEK